MLNSHRFKPQPLTTLIYICLLTALLCLGQWQLSRAEQKRVLLDKQSHEQTKPAIKLSAAPMNALPALRYQAVQLKGHYDGAHSFLLDNQISAGKVGYFVLTPFIDDNAGVAVLINRGWVQGNAQRNQLPQVPVDTQPRQLNARLNAFPSVGIIIDGAQIPSANWPSVLQVINEAQVAKKLGYAIMPFQLELNPNEPDGFKRDWQTNTLMPPQQHLAYAMQWFALALTLSALFIRYSFKKITP